MEKCSGHSRRGLFAVVSLVSLCSSITPQQTAEQAFDLLLYECLCARASWLHLSNTINILHGIFLLLKAPQLKDAIKMQPGFTLLWMLIQKPLTS